MLDRSMTKLCDGCRVSNAAIYCTADLAYMCLGCDLKIHGANKLASRHERVWICEVCEHAPAAVICKADAAALCSSCDTDIHSANPLANRHERVAVTPFFECPSTIKVAHINSSSVLPNLITDCWTHHQIVVAAAAAAAAAAAGAAPGFGPGFNSSEGALFDSNLEQDHLDSFLDLGNQSPSLVNQQAQAFFQDPTATYSLTKSSSFAAVPESSSSIGEISKPYPGNMIEFLCQIDQQQQMPKDGIPREERVLRYREKRKNRKFEKTVRYASRKAYAEIRPRIKGRFVKRSDVEHFVLSAMADSVVPSF